MQNTRIRKLMAIAAVSGAALTSSLVIAGPAHADNFVIWNCVSATFANTHGAATGDQCTPIALGTRYTGPGDLVVNGVAKDSCNNFTYVSEGTNVWAVFGNVCTIIWNPGSRPVAAVRPGE